MEIDNSYLSDDTDMYFAYGTDITRKIVSAAKNRARIKRNNINKSYKVPIECDFWFYCDKFDYARHLNINHIIYKPVKCAYNKYGLYVSYTTFI
jgi:hypothetical protein